ncbi:uncharacterized protein CBL_06935 [Carabus blaptoides fortunei]
MSSTQDGDVSELKIKSIIGFDGATVGGLRIHPDGIHVVYPIGNKITVLNWQTKKQDFLSGHTNVISAIDVSKSGKYLASGQINHIGFRALVIIWDFKTKTIRAKHEMHKVRVESVAFSKGDNYLISLGGRDCSSIVVWDIERNKAEYGAPASKGTQGEATVICVTNRREQCFVTAGEETLIVWKIEQASRKLCSIDVNVSKLKRKVLCMVMDEDDKFLYCGTNTGDVFKIKLNYHANTAVTDPVCAPIMVGCYGRINEREQTQQKVDLYSMGVRAIICLNVKVLLIGAGDGTINAVEETTFTFKSNTRKLPTTPQLRVLKSTNVRTMVTSLSRMNKLTVLAGTVASEIFSIDVKTFEKKLLLTCHTSTIYDLAFPHKFSEVFATASKDDVRVWNVSTMEELLRIQVANFCCSSVVFAHNGKFILTGWNDGIIRTFTPLTGRLIYAITNAHNKGVSALALGNDDKMIVSGGCEGQVRVWQANRTHQILLCTLKEHHGPISAIHMNTFGDEAVTASTDGTCIIWDLVRQSRKQVLFANTLFMCARFYTAGFHILTGGSDRKIAYWDVSSGTLIRELEGSSSAGINTLDISPDGAMFVTGANDQMIKLWKYKEGVVTHIGTGHSGVITGIQFSPDGRTIISTSASGSIFAWECPFDLAEKETNIDLLQFPSMDEHEEHVSEIGTDRQEELKKKMQCICKDQ